MKKSLKNLVGAFILALGLVAGGLMIAEQVSSMNEKVVMEQSVEINMDRTISVLP